MRSSSARRRSLGTKCTSDFQIRQHTKSRTDTLVVLAFTRQPAAFRSGKSKLRSMLTIAGCSYRARPTPSQGAALAGSPRLRHSRPERARDRHPFLIDIPKSIRPSRRREPIMVILATSSLPSLSTWPMGGWKKDVETDTAFGLGPPFGSGLATLLLDGTLSLLSPAQTTNAASRTPCAKLPAKPAFRPLALNAVPSSL